MTPHSLTILMARLILSSMTVTLLACTPSRHDLPEGGVTFIDGQDSLLSKNLGPVEKRAIQIEAATPERFDQHTLLLKMIESRAAILYLADILPEKGNPYYHMAQFGAQSLEQAFVKAINRAPELNERELFLPDDNGAAITQERLESDKELDEIIHYFAQYVATATVLEKLVFPVLAHSPLILPLSESASPEVAVKFARTFGNPKANQQGHIQYISRKYSALFIRNPILQKILDQKQKRVTLNIVSILAEAMEPHLDHVSDGTDKSALHDFIENVKTARSLAVSDQELASTKIRISQIFDQQSPEMKAAEFGLKGVALPDSGDIDGAEEAFEVVMRLDIGFDVLKALKEEVMKW